MLDSSTLLTAAAGLAGMLITYWLGTASTAAKDRRDLSERLREALRTRQNFSSPPGVARPTEDEFHRMLTLTPVFRRARLRAAIHRYQRLNSEWDQDEIGQPLLRDPKGAEAARDRLLELLP